MSIFTSFSCNVQDPQFDVVIAELTASIDTTKSYFHLGFGYDISFSKSTHSVFRAGYTINIITRHAYIIWNKKYVVDKVSENKFVQKEMSTDDREQGMVHYTNIISYNT